MNGDVFVKSKKMHYLCLRNLTSNIMHAFHADINKRLSIVSASASQTWDWNEKEWSKGCSVGSLWNEAFRAGFHGLWQGFNGQKDGGDFKTDFLAGFVSSLTGSVVGGGNLVTLGATTLSGGLVELAFDGTGNAFLRGAKIGLEIGALNHCGGDWYEDEEGNLKCFYSCSPKVKSKGRIWRNKGHVLTKNGKYYSLFGQRYEKGSRNGRFARLLDEGVMNTARYEAIASVESSSGYYTSEQINPAMTDFSNFCIDTGMLPDNAVYYDYGGYKGNACITFKTNTANMLVCATNFSGSSRKCVGGCIVIIRKISAIILIENDLEVNPSIHFE